MARVARVRVQSYKAFRDSGWVELGHRFTVVIGRNNGGKTALLQAIANRISDSPHRSLMTVPERGRRAPPPKLEVDYLCGFEDFVRAAHAGQGFHAPLPRNIDWADVPRGLAEASALVPADSVRIHVSRPANSEWSLRGDPGYSAPFHPSDYVVLRNDGTAAHVTGPSGGWPTIVAQHASNRIYMFNAERLRIDRARVVHQTNLAPDASNLAACLNTMQSNVDLFEEFNELVAQVLPEVKWVSVPTLPDTNPADCQVKVWLVDRSTKRDDLALPLSECGTGVGQVLAILYVVLTSEVPTTIVIDEPQSFLHPGATWKLMEILRGKATTHQFVVSTHSPGIIAAVEPDVVLNVVLDGEEAKVRAVNLNEVNELRSILDDVGSRWSDVFGADRVLWVEGRTEEAFFPQLLHAAGIPLVGTRVVGVINTGDFDARLRPKARLVREIYEKLSRGSSLLPPSVAFVFDQDGKTSDEMRDAARDSGGKIRFLQRRLFENYLLDPRAITEIIRRRGGNATLEDIEMRLQEAMQSRESVPHDAVARVRSDSAWLVEVHGAELLERVFLERLPAGSEFRKTRDSVDLANWLLQADPTVFSEIVDLLGVALARS